MVLLLLPIYYMQSLRNVVMPDVFQQPRWKMSLPPLNSVAPPLPAPLPPMQPDGLPIDNKGMSFVSILTLLLKTTPHLLHLKSSGLPDAFGVLTFRQMAIIKCWFVQGNPNERIAHGNP
jgi:hypothetical protein